MTDPGSHRSDAGDTSVPTAAQRLAAEALGSYALVLLGCATIVMLGSRGDLDIVSIGLAFGFVMAVLVATLGRLSGGHFNPAISVGAGVAGRLAWPEVGRYAAAQVGGAVLAGASLWVLAHGFAGFDATEHGLGQNFFGDEGTGYAWWAALLLEAVLTAMLVLVALAVTDRRQQRPALAAPLTIGLALAALHLASVPATLTSVNPARSIGPALFAGGDAVLQLWVFLLAPLTGALAAGLLYPLLAGRDGDPVPGSGLALPRRRAAAGPDTHPDHAAGQQAGTGWDTGGWGTGGWGASRQVQQPIIQDGWMWDAARQQWVPAPPEYLGRAHQGRQHDPQHDPQHEPPEGRGEDPGTGTTQLRPPEQP